MFFRSLYRRVDRILYILGDILVTQKELAAALDAVNANLVKIGGETKTLLTMVADLQAQLANAPVTP